MTEIEATFPACVVRATASEVFEASGPVFELPGVVSTLCRTGWTVTDLGLHAVDPGLFVLKAERARSKPALVD